MASEEAPNEFLCPISLEVMIDPVVARDGRTYEREVIQHWFDRGHRISPATAQSLESTTLTPNKALQSLIVAWQQGRSDMVDGVSRMNAERNRSTADLAALRKLLMHVKDERKTLRKKCDDKSREITKLREHAKTVEDFVAQPAATIDELAARLAPYAEMEEGGPIECEEGIGEVASERIRARAFALVGRNAEAMAALRRAVTYHSHNVDVLADLALLYKSAGDLDGALECLERALKVTPLDPELQNCRGVVLLLLGRDKDALEIFQRLVDMHRQNGAYWRNLGDCHRARGNLQVALMAYNEAYKIDPKHAETKAARSAVIAEIEKTECVLQ